MLTWKVEHQLPCDCSLICVSKWLLPHTKKINKIIVVSRSHSELALGEEVWIHDVLGKRDRVSAHSQPAHHSSRYQTRKFSLTCGLDASVIGLWGEPSRRSRFRARRALWVPHCGWPQSSSEPRAMIAAWMYLVWVSCFGNLWRPRIRTRMKWLISNNWKDLYWVVAVRQWRRHIFERRPITSRSCWH